MVYQSAALRSVTGSTIRPGGFSLTGRAIEFCGFPPESELLDVGCGAGATVEYLRERHRLNAVGIDHSRRMLEEAWERNLDLPLGLGTAEHIPAEPASKDGVVCECVLSLLARPKRALAEFCRVLRPGGFLILSDLYERHPAGEERGNGVVSRAMLERMLERCGFTILLWEDHSRLLRELAARLVLAHGSRTKGLFAGCGCGGERPGYYLMIAAKSNREDA